VSGFRYEAVDGDGRRQRGVLESDSARQARAVLRGRGFLPVEVSPIGEEAGAGRAPWRRTSLGAAQLAVLTRQMATLLDAGLTIEQTFNALIEQTARAGERELLAAVRADVLAGKPLARALARHPRAFHGVYVTLVDAGERAGRLPDVLARLADYTESRDVLRGKVALAFVYPALVTLVAFAVVFGLLTYVVPQVVDVFRHTGQGLPALTRALIALADFTRDYGLVALLAGVATAVAVAVSLRAEPVRGRWDAALLRLPVVGPFVQGLNAATLGATLAILVGSRVPLVTALAAGAGVVSSLPMRRALEEAAQRVQEGWSLARALGASKLFPPLMIHMIASGEASGRLGEMLERNAAQQARDLERRIGVFVTLLEPMLILAMGGIVLAIVLGILLPVFELNTLVR
jgi:general secretion pathway protein F